MRAKDGLKLQQRRIDDRSREGRPRLIAPALGGGRGLRHKVSDILKTADRRRQEENKGGKAEGHRDGPLRALTQHDHVRISRYRTPTLLLRTSISVTLIRNCFQS